MNSLLCTFLCSTHNGMLIDNAALMKVAAHACHPQSSIMQEPELHFERNLWYS